jgi:CRP-like cAMP-binding protein
LPPRCLEGIIECATPYQFRAGQTLFREGDEADKFFILRNGRIDLEISAPTGGSMSVQSVRGGEILGWSWLFPPFRWHFDGRSVENGEGLSVDAACLKATFETDPDLGYHLMTRFARVLMQRLQATRRQLLDVSGRVSDN